ncbi:hypothetical protein LCGC14_0344850 [marine sediment metagenome]|uniref:Uncharacterized protein n=1 Tax=marine sediment metagenome TaxID=412755 RepID=A0A0F9TIE4_9ZZZZ
MPTNPNSGGGFSWGGGTQYGGGSPTPDWWQSQDYAGGTPGMGGGPMGPTGNWYDQNSPMNQYYQGFAPSSAAMQGGTPGHLGQDQYYNPMTGESGWNDRAGTGFGRQRNAQGGMLSWTDPTTGNQMIDPGLLMGQFGGQGGGGGGYQNYNMTDYQGGQVTPGEGYQQFDYSAIGSGIDPSAVIAAQEYGLQERMEADMARAGGRAGQSGFAMSTPYMGELGEAARKASQDRSALTMQYQYDAAQSQAQRDLAQQQQAAQLDFGGWQTGYQGDMQSQMFNQGQGFDQWALENQFGMQNNQGQNYWNQQQNQNQQQMLMGLLGGMF